MLASATLALLFAAVLLAGSIAEAADAGAARTMAAVIGAATGQNVARADLLAEEGFVGVPDAFSREVMGLGGFSDVYSNSPGVVVGCFCDGEADETFDLVAGQLRDNGWTQVDSGQSNVGSFAKEQGEYRWLYVTCIQTADATSVVFQCRRVSDED